jgi:hypothetical protein
MGNWLVTTPIVIIGHDDVSHDIASDTAFDQECAVLFCRSAFIDHSVIHAELIRK